ncbi:MAG: chromate transporter [Anaerolineae bacterium]|nr:chromate transporter [Anaerolineae bacterium]MCI0608021.1 chromate transporter [Anaerolineae bacterium]
MSFPENETFTPPRESYPRLFLRFLRFGLLAWGGPVAQIAMIRQELVEEERWISPERFNRILAVYQVLPGPEAHELCVYFGMLARGRIGAILAGLGFMLPGFLLMFALSWFYVTYGVNSPIFAGIFYGFQAAVAALIVRAVHRIGGHALNDRWLWGIAIFSGIAQWLGLNFLLTLSLAGLIYTLVKRQLESLPSQLAMFLPVSFLSQAAAIPSMLALFVYGLRSGLLTFGGAYTAIPFLQHDAVVIGGWMTNQQFLDGLALSSILPAPLIIFSTFVGYLGGGPLGAILLTAGIFLPAFSFTLIGHNFFEKNFIENKAAHAFLDGVTAGVVGLIAVTTIGLFQAAVTDLPSLGIFIIALFALYRWKAKAIIPVVILGAGVVGLLFYFL